MSVKSTIDDTENIIVHDKANDYDENIINNEAQQFTESFKVLHPEDPLMKRFQNALKIHLIKVNERLTKKQNELTIANKQAEKERVQKGNELYEAQHEISNQITLIEKWRTSLEAIKCWRDDKNNDIKNMKETRNIMQQEFDKQCQRVESMAREIESVSSLCNRLNIYENEVSNHLAIAKRMSDKDARVQRELIHKKQEMDYIMLRATETVWNLEKELSDLQNRIKIKVNEESMINQTIADADSDLEALDREQKNLINSWNRVIFSIEQRDKLYDELSTQRMNMRESLKNMDGKLVKVKKDTIKKMEINELLTTIKCKLNDEISFNEGTIKINNDKYQVIVYKTDEIIKLMECTEIQFEGATSEYQRLINDEKSIDRQLEKLMTYKNTLEDELIAKLDDKITQNKTLKYLNKSLRDKREMIKQFELSMLTNENHYAKCLLDINKFNSSVSIENDELVELYQINNQKNKQLNKLNDDIEKCNLLIERKQKKIGELNKIIDEIKINMSENGMNMISPHIIKIESIEKNIEMIEIKNDENQRYWLRQEAAIVLLTDKRNDKLQEINRLSKQIIIIQQKNIKLTNAFNKEIKIEQNINKRMNDLHQRLLKTNIILAEQKEMRNQLKDKNYITEDEYTRMLQHTEGELINLQNKIKDLNNERCALDEKLQNEIFNNLSWEKKLKFAMDTTKIIKREQNPGGDVAIMKSEIRKMEMRLSYLKKVQEKMIKDMEYCITRREMIVDAALTRQMKNPKVMHNKRIMFDKRLDNRRLEIKQIKKVIKSIETETAKLKKENEILQCNEKESEKLLKNCHDRALELDKDIVECEIMKHHKLECLVRKQRKIKLLQSVRDGKYRIICKSNTLNDELNNQTVLNGNLIEIIEQTNQDFPLLKEDIRKILLTLQSK